MMNQKNSRFIGIPQVIVISILLLLFALLPQFHTLSFVLWSVFILILFLYLLRNNKIALQPARFLKDFYHGNYFSKNKKADWWPNHQHKFTLSIGSAGCALPQPAYVFDLGGINLSPEFSNNDAHTLTGTMENFDLLSGSSILKLQLGNQNNSHDTCFDLVRFATEADKSQLIELDLSTAKVLFKHHGLNLENPSPPQSIASLGLTMFSDAKAMVIFIDSLQQLSGKPVGIRISMGFKKELYNICHAICKTGIIPDFISIAPCPGQKSIQLYQSLMFLAETLRHYVLAGKIRLIVYVNISTAFDVLKFLSMGADAIIADVTSYGDLGQKSLAPDEATLSTRELFQLRNSVLQMIERFMREQHLKSYKEITIPSLFQAIDRTYTKSRYPETTFTYPLFI